VVNSFQDCRLFILGSSPAPEREYPPKRLHIQQSSRGNQCPRVPMMASVYTNLFCRGNTFHNFDGAGRDPISDLDLPYLGPDFDDLAAKLMAGINGNLNLACLPINVFVGEWRYPYRQSPAARTFINASSCRGLGIFYFLNQTLRPSIDLHQRPHFPTLHHGSFRFNLPGVPCRSTKELRCLPLSLFPEPVSPTLSINPRHSIAG